MNLIKNINMILAFLLELSAIFILGIGDFHLISSKFFTFKASKLDISLFSLKAFILL